MSEKFGSNSVDEIADELNSVVQVGLGGMPGVITDDLETI
jgi:hypothetical protein